MSPRLFILDQGLKSVGGHYFEYVRSIAEASTKCGIDCVIACHKEGGYLRFSGGEVHPIYTYGVWDAIRGESYDSSGSLLAVSESFAKETRRFLAEYSLRQGDIILMPNIAKPHIMAAALLAEEYGPHGADLYFMLRYPSHFFTGGIAKKAFQRLDSAASRHHVFLCTDSHRLVGEFTRVYSNPLHILPIPHTDYLGPTSESAREIDSLLHIVSLGNARGEKGFREIFKAVRLSAYKPWANLVRFTIQANDPYDAEDAVAEFRQFCDPRVTLIDHVLQSEAYYYLLAESDVVLTPYHRSVYRERTSGIFLEALLAGKITICTDDTWMSDVLNVQGGGIAVEDESPIAICGAIEKIVRNRALFSAKAHSSAEYWKPIHSPENFIAHLTGRESKEVVVPRARRAFVIFPWGDALSGKSGSSVRLNLLVKFLEQHYDEVRVLFAGVSEPAGLIGTRSTADIYRYYRIRAWLLRVILYGFSMVLGGSKKDSFHLWYHLWPRLDNRFRAKCEELVGWADEVYAEYTYFVPVLAPYCRMQGKNLNVTMHDIVSDQSNHPPLIHAATRALEFGALKDASRVYVVGETEKAALLEQGISAEIIPNPIDVDESLPIFLPEERSAILKNLFQIPEAGRKICLFVGSGYDPNRTAAAFIRKLAARMHHDSRGTELLFIVAGNCMEADQHENFMALGMIERAALVALYERADIVLIPLTEGTGLSVKSIEALAHGALIISTRVGMRGLSVEHERHCLIEDDLSAYPERILDLLSNPTKGNAMRLEAAAFGACFDYRAIFARYGREGTAYGPGEDKEEIIAKRRRNAAEELLPRIRLLTDTESRKYFYKSFQVDEVYDLGAQKAASRGEKGPAMRSLLKYLALRITPIRRLYEQRNMLLREVNTLNENANAVRTRTELEARRSSERLDGIEGRLGAIRDRIQKIETVLQDQGSNLEDIGSFTKADFPIWTSRLELQLRDIVEQELFPSRLPKLGWIIHADRQIAADSIDHLFPRGTKNDNTRHPRFVRRCEELLGASVRHMDLGCAGGGLVWDFTRRGHSSVGVEGSDYNLRAQRAEWGTIPDRLFTADVCYPFHFEDMAHCKVTFDIISAWELFEHIPEELLPGLLQNVTTNLRPGGYLVASIATFPEIDDATEAVYHHTIKPRDWWEERFKSIGLSPTEGMFQTDDFVRGSGNSTAYDWDVRLNPEMGFHITLRYEP